MAVCPSAVAASSRPLLTAQAGQALSSELRRPSFAVIESEAFAPYDRGIADEAGGHVPVTRRQWDERMAAWFERSDQALSVFCYRLDPTTGAYSSAGVHAGKMTVTDPVSISIDLASLL